MRRRRWDEELDERERPAKPKLKHLDEGRRAGVLEELQRSGGNSALQRVVGAELQRDTTTAEKPAKPTAAATARWLLAIDGKIVGALGAVAGGGARAEVITEAHFGGTVRKHLGTVAYEPYVLRIGLGMGSSVFDWINDALSLQHRSQNLTLHAVDGAGKESRQADIDDALLTRFELPRLAAEDTGAALLTLTVAPEDVRWRQGSGQKLDTKLASDPIVPSTARLDVSGIGQVPGLRSVEPWGFDLKVVEERVGNLRKGERHPATVDLGSLVVTLSDTGKGTEAFDGWFDDFAVKGNSTAERTATLTVSSKGGRKLQVSFTGVGIVAASHLPRSDGGRRYELYVEGAKLSVSS